MIVRDENAISPKPGSLKKRVSIWKISALFVLRMRYSFWKLLPNLADTRQVKSIAVNPSTDPLAYVQGEGGYWWAENIHFFTPRMHCIFPESICAKSGGWVTKTNLIPPRSLLAATAPLVTKHCRLAWFLPAPTNTMFNNILHELMGGSLHSFFHTS